MDSSGATSSQPKKADNAETVIDKKDGNADKVTEQKDADEAPVTDIGKKDGNAGKTPAIDKNNSNVKAPVIVNALVDIHGMPFVSDKTPVIDIEKKDDNANKIIDKNDSNVKAPVMPASVPVGLQPAGMVWDGYGYVRVPVTVQKDGNDDAAPSVVKTDLGVEEVLYIYIYIYIYI